jgi:adenine-specific DNA-methyltransferase
MTQAGSGRKQFLMAKKTKLELTWIGKEERPRLEPRILLEDPELSYHAARQVTESDQFDNRVIYGDNLLALKALEAEFTGKVKCIYIDPPYNTGSAFTHYDDGLEHSLWLTMMRDRLVLLRRLLAENGTIWITLDDNEAHYAKVLCDEIFGRDNFLGTVIWEKSDSPRMDAEFFSSRHDFILTFAKNKSQVSFNRLNQNSDDLPEHYDKVDETGRRYYLKPLRAMGGQGDSRAARPNLYYALTSPEGTEIYPKKQDGTDGAWRWGREKVEQEKSRIEWRRGRSEWTPYFRIYADTSSGRPPETLWFHAEVGSNRTSKAEIKALFPDLTPFSTPKPERLLQRVIELSTNPGDLVLDSFAGSGTTGAVAHKMGRRLILVELGEHVHTHILPRLRKVVDGEDPGGITAAVNWRGGGGFRYFRLAPSLLVQDKYGNYIINRDYNAEMLAEAMCKHESFTYAPSETVYWQHGRSSETDFIYVTTQSLTRDQLVALSEDVGPDRTLLVCAFAFRARDGEFPNLTFKKIPNAVLHRCEWGRDDYSLQISQLPPPEETAGPESEAAEPAPANGKSRRKRRGEPAAAATLFADAESGGDGKNVSEA